MQSTPIIPESPTLPPREFPLPPAVRTFWIWMISLSVLSAFMCDVYYYIHRFERCCTLPYDDPFFDDFWSYNYIFHSLHTNAFFESSRRFAYPVFSAVAYDMVYHLGHHAQAIYFTGELVVCSLATYLFFRKIRHIGLRIFPAALLVISTLLFSYPLLLLFMTGNIEIFTCILTAAGLWAMLKKHDHAAAVLWGAAAALKIYPIILLGLFLSRAKVRSLAVGIAAFFGISVVSMLFVGPTIYAAFAGSLSGVGGFVSSYADKVRLEELPIDHSLLAPVKIFAYWLGHRVTMDSYLTKPYLLIAGATALLAFFFRAWSLPVANQVLFFFAAMVALPPVSYDYTLVHLYAPWAMLVVVALRTGTSARILPGLATCFLCFAVLFTSQRFLFYNAIYANGTFKAIALVILIVTALRYPIPDEVIYGHSQMLHQTYPISTTG